MADGADATCSQACPITAGRRGSLASGLPGPRGLRRCAMRLPGRAATEGHHVRPDADGGLDQERVGFARYLSARPGARIAPKPPAATLITKEAMIRSGTMCRPMSARPGTQIHGEL